MDWVAWKKQVVALAGKYKAVLLILAVGIFLMMLPEQDKQMQSQALPTETLPVTDLTEQLTDILSQIQGVGKVRLLLTESAGQETVYQMDEDRNQSENGSSVRLETVILSGDGCDRGLIRTVTPPVYLGAVVVCQGGDHPAVRLSVVEAVASVTGIGADRITVLKMK